MEQINNSKYILIAARQGREKETENIKNSM